MNTFIWDYICQHWADFYWLSGFHKRFLYHFLSKPSRVQYRNFHYSTFKIKKKEIFEKEFFIVTCYDLNKKNTKQDILQNVYNMYAKFQKHCYNNRSF